VPESSPNSSLSLSSESEVVLRAHGYYSFKNSPQCLNEITDSNKKAFSVENCQNILMQEKLYDETFVNNLIQKHKNLNGDKVDFRAIMRSLLCDKLKTQNNQ